MVNSVVNYYEGYDEEARLSKDKSHSIEFITTTNFLERYIKSNCKLLEVGAGTGRYSYYYANKGISTVAFELVDKNIEIMSSKNRAQGNPIDIVKGNAIDLSEFKNESFDVVLCLGPLYHLQEKEDKSKCISESIRVLKPGGLIAFSYINKHGAIMKEIVSKPESTLNSEVISHLTSKCHDLNGVFNYMNPGEIQEFIQGNLTVLHVIGTDGLAMNHTEVINQLSEAEFDEYINYHLSTCEEPSIHGSSLHGLIIATK